MCATDAVILSPPSLFILNEDLHMRIMCQMCDKIQIHFVYEELETDRYSSYCSGWFMYLSSSGPSTEGGWRQTVSKLGQGGKVSPPWAGKFNPRMLYHTVVNIRLSINQRWFVKPKIHEILFDRGSAPDPNVYQQLALFPFHISSPFPFPFSFALAFLFCDFLP